MEESTAKEKVLKKIRNALISRAETPYPSAESESHLYTDSEESLDVTFAEEFTRTGGMFVYCEDTKELVSNLMVVLDDFQEQDIFCMEEMVATHLVQAGIPFSSAPDDLTGCKIGITGCESLVARLGSIVISSYQTRSRRISVFPDSHIVIGFSSQLVPDLQQALTRIKTKYDPNFPSMISVITGPSRTADIEKTLVMGAHGPRNLYLFYVDRR